MMPFPISAAVRPESRDEAQRAASCDKLTDQAVNSGWSRRKRSATLVTPAPRSTWINPFVKIPGRANCSILKPVSLLRLVRTAIRRRGAASTGTTRSSHHCDDGPDLVEDKWCADSSSTSCQYQARPANKATKSLPALDHKEHVLDAFEFRSPRIKLKSTPGLSEGDMGSRAITNSARSCGAKGSRAEGHGYLSMRYIANERTGHSDPCPAANMLAHPPWMLSAIFQAADCPKPCLRQGPDDAGRPPDFVMQLDSSHGPLGSATFARKNERYL